VRITKARECHGTGSDTATRAAEADDEVVASDRHHQKKEVPKQISGGCSER
jgi:hypothetical protein